MNAGNEQIETEQPGDASERMSFCNQKEAIMIARIWRGRTVAAQADKYLDYLQETGVKGARTTPGNRGVRILRRITGQEAEFLFVSFWDSLDAIQAFAGPDIERAVYFPEDTAFLLELEPTVAHYEVFNYE
jgi:heme-degrading monooxygenase HmoA